MANGRGTGIYVIVAILAVVLVVLTLIWFGVFGDSVPDPQPDAEVIIETPQVTPGPEDRN